MWSDKRMMMDSFIKDNNGSLFFYSFKRGKNTIIQAKNFPIDEVMLFCGLVERAVSLH